MDLVHDFTGSGSSARNTKKLRKSQDDTNARLDALTEQLAETNRLLAELVSERQSAH